MYINNRNGTFSERASSVLKHTSFYAMGIDIADINNDGLPDIMTLDMRPEGNFRQKTSMWETPFDWDQLVNNPNSAANRQYVRNALQINTGLGTFVDIGELAGVDAGLRVGSDVESELVLVDKTAVESRAAAVGRRARPSDRQPLPTPCAPSCQHPSAPGCPHPGAEAVLLGAMALLRLVSLLHPFARDPLVPASGPASTPRS